MGPRNRHMPCPKSTEAIKQKRMGLTDRNDSSGIPQHVEARSAPCRDYAGRAADLPKEGGEWILSAHFEALGLKIPISRAFRDDSRPIEPLVDIEWLKCSGATVCWR